MGLYATRNFFLDVLDSDVEAEREDDSDHSVDAKKKDATVRIGVWHVLPKHVVKRFAKELQIDEVSIVK